MLKYIKRLEYKADKIEFLGKDSKTVAEFTSKFSDTLKFKGVCEVHGDFKFYRDIWIYNGERLRLKRTADVNTGVEFYDNEGIRKFVIVFDNNDIISLFNSELAASVWKVNDAELILYTRDIKPYADNTHDLGSSSSRWANVYAVNVVTGDVKFDNKWKITEYDEDGKLIDGLRVLNTKGEEVLRITNEGVWFKGEKIA